MPTPTLAEAARPLLLLPTLVGFSVSFCVKDVLQGYVMLQDIAFLTAGTCARTEAEWDEVIAYYSAIYWRQDPAQAEFVIRSLLERGLVLQPRLEGQQPHAYNGGGVIHRGRTLQSYWAAYHAGR